MITSIKEAVLGSLREWIASEADHTLRVARIKGVRLILDGLEEEANRTIKPIDYPLYFFEEYTYWYAACGKSDQSWLLIREDVDPEVLKWASSCCGSHNWYVRDNGVGNDFEAGKPHPLYPGFASMVEFGNKVTPSKRYYKGYYFRYQPASIREGLRKRLGDRCWTKDTLPRDVKGEKVYWG